MLITKLDNKKIPLPFSYPKQKTKPNKNNKNNKTSTIIKKQQLKMYELSKYIGVLSVYREFDSHLYVWVYRYQFQMSYHYNFIHD